VVKAVRPHDSAPLTSLLVYSVVAVLSDLVVQLVAETGKTGKYESLQPIKRQSIQPLLPRPLFRFSLASNHATESKDISRHYSPHHHTTSRKVRSCKRHDRDY
jgi:hypothetical protein